MDAISGIRGREDELRDINQFITTSLNSNSSGVLYLAGPPGTGKSMSMEQVLENIDKKIPRVNINCAKSLSSKTLLSRVCTSLELDKLRCNETEMIARLIKKFTGKPHIIVLDEMDRLPKSKNLDLIKLIFSWPKAKNSRLILIGIANTVNLTSRYQVINSILRNNDLCRVTKIIFRPYSSKAIKDILNWYIENDENFEDAQIDEKALDLISRKFARENGDIRGALNALKSAIDDSVMRPHLRSTTKEDLDLETPPPTPPLSPRKDRFNNTNIASVANSIKKRQRDEEERVSFPMQVILKTVAELCDKEKDNCVDSRVCWKSVSAAFQSYGLKSSSGDYKQMLENLQVCGLITLKRPMRGDQKIKLNASKSELSNLAETFQL